MAGNTALKLASTPAERVLQHVEFTHAAMEKAAAYQSSVMAKEAAAAAKIDSVCDALIAADRVRADQRVKLAEALKDHASTLDLLQKLASHRTAEELARLGQGSDNLAKTASARGNRPFAEAGARKQAGAVLFSRLGLPTPADA